MGTVARSVHLPILTRRSDLFEIVAACDLSTDALDLVSHRFGLPPASCTRDPSQLLDHHDLEALAVLNSGSHAETVVRALERDLAVFCEKPLAYTHAEADAIEAALEGRTGRLMVGYMKLHDPAVATARELIAARPLPRSAEVTVVHPSPESQLAHSELDPHPVDLPAEVRERLSVAARRLQREALGGAADRLGPLYADVLLGSLIHDLAVLRGLGLGVDRIDFVERWPEGEFPASVAVLARTASDVRVSLRWHYLPEHARYRETIELHDDEGTVTLVFPSPYVLRAPTELQVVDRSGAGGVHEQRFRTHAEAFEEQWDVFHRVVRGTADSPAGLDDARTDLIICQQIAKVLASREDIEVGGEAASPDRPQPGTSAITA